MQVNFPPTRQAGLDRLAEFLPRSGRAYAAERNYDRPGHSDVSRLSPYIRRRLVTEAEVLQAVLGRFAPSTAEKFIQEVFWRTYWKGWLEMRPSVWTQYRAGVKSAYDRIQTEAGLRAGWEAACLGETEIDCFNSWAQELVSTGYMHNHARMWFASIWIFKLRLPWELGADFFLRHLLDGDPASNTLSWRWVAGLQTKGKTYLARPSNIEKYTEGRFKPSSSELAGFAAPLDGPVFDRIDPPVQETFDPQISTGVLLHEEDLEARALYSAFPDAPILCMSSIDHLSPGKIAPHLSDFVKDSFFDAYQGLTDRTEEFKIVSDRDAVLGWAQSHELQQIVAPYAPVSPAQDALEQIQADLADVNIRLVRRISEYDLACWPHATHGFFRFKDKIPKLISELGLDRDSAAARQGTLFAT